MMKVVQRVERIGGMKLFMQFQFTLSFHIMISLTCLDLQDAPSVTKRRSVPRTAVVCDMLHGDNRCMQVSA